jgi:hypothetical protein
MCLVKNPKVVTSTAAENKEAPVITNPYLDGLPSILRARRGGVQSLTIRRTNGSGTATTPPTVPRPVTPTTPRPVTPTPSPGGGRSSTGTGRGGGGLIMDELARAPSLTIKKKVTQ